MAGFSDAAETAIMSLIFTATAWANMADNAAATPQTTIAWALHTADPTDAGNMTSNEVSTGQYAGYARASTNRNTGGMTVTAGSVSPVANVVFPLGTGGTGATASYFSVGKSGGGATAIHMSGQLNPSVAVGNAIQPTLTTATTLALD